MATLVHYVHVYSAITRLGWLVYFSIASFADPVNFHDWNNRTHGGCYMEGMGLKSTPVIGGHLIRHLSMFCPNGRFNLPPTSLPPPSPAPPPSHLSIPYNVPSVILYWFWKKLLEFQQCKLATRNSYKMLATVGVKKKFTYCSCSTTVIRLRYA